MLEKQQLKVLMPGRVGKKATYVEPIKLDGYWLGKALRPNKLAYLPHATLAALGRQASGGGTERYLRGVAFVNSASRGNQDPETVCLLAFLHRNADSMLTAEELLVEYKKQLRKGKTATEQAADVAGKRARTQGGGAVAGAGAVDDEMLVDAILDDDARQAVVKGFEDFLADLDERQAMAWAGQEQDQGAGASTHEVIELAQDDDDDTAAAAAPAANAATVAAEHPHATHAAAAAARG